MFFNIYFSSSLYPVESTNSDTEQHAIPSRAMITNRNTHDFGGEGEDSPPFCQPFFLCVGLLS
jgi:hypothetical protein